MDLTKILMESSHRYQLLTNRQLPISCVVPVYNEKALIADFLVTLQTQLAEISDNYQIIVVDDGSDDGTISAIPNIANTKVIQLSRNFGKEAALFAGLQFANSEVTIIIDADFQHPIELIPLFLQHWAKGFDMVYGIQANRPHETWLKKALARVFYKIMQSSSKVKLIAHAGDFRLLSNKVVAAILACTEKNRFTKGLYCWVGFDSIGIPFTAKSRKCGKSSLSLIKLTELAITGITAFSNIPLRIWSFIGLIIASIAFTHALFIIAKTLLLGVDVPGYASLIVTIMFFGGIQLLSIGVIGEYIAKIFNEVKNRPNYIVKQIIEL